ncbi:MAG TPA: type II and III secretion system protein family protein [Alphaproteobacteria bacterium]|nr:type II and III secretion system protein family protein [Alphaproteobacteria bacterium]
MKILGKNRLKSLKKAAFFSALFVSIFCTLLSPVMGKVFKISVDGAEILKFENGVSEVFIANPEIADVQLSNRNTVYLFGKGVGTTKIFVLDTKGKEVINAEVVVSQDLTQLRQMIAAYDPHGLVEITALPGGILLEGVVESPKEADNIRSLADKYIKKSKDSEQIVVNRLTIRPPVQINLRVKVAEVARSVLNQLGFDWQSVVFNRGKFKLGTLINRAPFTATPILTNDVTSITQPTATTAGQQASSIGFGYHSTHENINLAIDLLAEDSLVTILAEPNLTCISGETATFLAGGEFPYPVPQQLGNITIDFKNYGVSLAFTPTVLDGSLISLHVRPEVSELDPTTGITLNGTTVPGILTRRVETTIQLGSGETFAIGGLLKNTVVSSIDSLPGLGDIPILGTLFRSNSFQRGDSELVILVTPYIVEPASGKEMILPTDGLNYPTLLEQVFERRLVKPGVEKGHAPAYGPGGVRLMGPAGFSIE